MIRGIYKYLAVMLLTMAVLISGCGNGNSDNASEADSNNTAATAEAKGQLTVKVLDVGQGDAILINTGEQVILIDTGDDKYREDNRKDEDNNQLFAALDKEGIKHIDKLIMTHAHADHIGKAAKVIKKYGVTELVHNGIPSASGAFRNALKAAKAQGTKQVKVKAGDVLDFGNGVSFKVLSPTTQIIENDTRDLQADKKVNVNNESIVGILTFGDFSMLLTGDAEKEIEKDLLAAYGNSLKCKVYKAPHHGSHTSSTFNYVKTVQPEYAIISCGTNNRYGHPHKETMQTLKKLNVNVLETDKSGTVTVITDGKTYSVKGEK
ncbi:beta-lactamase domain protein [Anaerovibrio sp. JC8]|uniref:ComEC/Rec2 family competence protein n=1 Tax=Anaerovibrio sp. JC8 TaxID=1240085 RepID=UPI000A0A5A57|nr:ComEC/Rec2 family competence protein [Anaerovibrio sp. JC8]ORU01313.1 beta-lactamase domain protein [Anaerovibrio sp. JC8]